MITLEEKYEGFRNDNEVLTDRVRNMVAQIKHLEDKLIQKNEKIRNQRLEIARLHLKKKEEEQLELPLDYS